MQGNAHLIRWVATMAQRQPIARLRAFLPIIRDNAKGRRDSTLFFLCPVSEAPEQRVGGL